jgi:signal transduction histidine kinase
VQLRRGEGWAELAAALAQESALRAEAEGRLQELEHLAALGRYISEARHGLGNALTSVLGNSELLLTDDRLELAGDVRGQLEIIHQMSMRILRTLQGLASLDVEMMRKKRGASC